ncbi:hypothetical protein ACHQM5_009615 [Ranunculus cassubicifolius]
MFLRKLKWPSSISPLALRQIQSSTLTTKSPPIIIPCDITTTTRTIVPYDRRERLISIYKTILQNIESVPKSVNENDENLLLKLCFTQWKDALEELTRFRLLTCEKYPHWELIEKIGMGKSSPNGLIEEAKLENEQLCKSIEYYYGASRKISSENPTNDKPKD